LYPNIINYRSSYQVIVTQEGESEGSIEESTDEVDECCVLLFTRYITNIMIAFKMNLYSLYVNTIHYRNSSQVIVTQEGKKYNGHRGIN